MHKLVHVTKTEREKFRLTCKKERKIMLEVEPLVVGNYGNLKLLGGC